MPKSPILGGFSTQRSSDAADNAAINLQVEVIETKDGKVPGFLFLASGLDLIGTIGTGPIRGLLALNDILYIVSGMEVWSLTPNGIATFCGTIGNQATPVSMFQNTRQLMIVDGVGGWLVPGGYPLTGGTISEGGGLYKPGDTITLKSATGSQSSFPILLVTAISNFSVSQFALVNAGTTYNTASNVATAPIQPQAGVGTGLTINISSVSASGGITGATVGVGGVGYSAGDTGTVSTGNGQAVYRVTSVAGGVVTGFIMLNPGASYGVAGGIPTTAGPGVPNNLGTGFTIDTTATGGPIATATVAGAGQNFVVGNVGFITGGTDDATYLVFAVNESGAVTGFTIQQPGAVNDHAASFTQQSTDGSGSGFILIDPSYGAFVGLVSVALPFPDPLVGDVSDGFGVLMFQGQQYLAASLELDLSTWPALSYGVADQSPDNCVSLKVIHDEVFLLKQNNTEVWIDQGTANFPFGPITSVHVEAGIMAPFSVAKADEELIWLSRNDQGQGVVVMATGYRIDPISTQALVNEFQTYANIGDAIAYVRQEGGHVYYVITFPEANKTWAFDKTASKLVGYPIWTQLAAFENGQFNRHWGNAFTPWTGSVKLVVTPESYQPESVLITQPTQLETSGALVGLPLSFSSAVFSVWIDIPDSGTNTGIVFGNQTGGPVPGMQITIQNDNTGSPQITVEAWDASFTPIVVATYDFSSWAAWVNLLISIDTASQQLQVWANSGAEQELTAASLVWSSSNPIGTTGGQPWSVGVI